MIRTTTNAKKMRTTREYAHAVSERASASTHNAHQRQQQRTCVRVTQHILAVFLEAVNQTRARAFEHTSGGLCVRAGVARRLTRLSPGGQRMPIIYIYMHICAAVRGSFIIDVTCQNGKISPTVCSQDVNRRCQCVRMDTWQMCPARERRRPVL